MLDQKSREILYYKVPVFVTDLLMHWGVLWAALTFLSRSTTKGLTNEWEIYGLLALAFAGAVSQVGIRLHERKIKIGVIAYRAIKQTLLTYLLFTVLLVLTYKATPRQMLTCEILVMTPLITLWHIAVNQMVRRFRQRGHNTRVVLLVGGGAAAADLYDELCEGQSLTGYRVLGYLNDWPSDDAVEGMTYLGKLDDLENILADMNVDEIYCTLPPAVCGEQVKKVIQLCNDRFIEFYFVPRMKGYPKRTMRIDRRGNVNVIRLHEEPMNKLKSKVFKRSFDILLSGLFLCTIYPFVCLFVWLGNMLLGNRGSLYFKQTRTGYNGKDFTMYKFRSMRPSAEADTKQATKDDPRKTPFGDFLRRSSIDELPQFINVLKGDMSIIGPRPHMLFHTQIYSDMIGDYMVRHLAKPGITGYAQVNGCRGETQTPEEMRNRVEHDIWYIEHWTPMLDIVIFFKTIGQLLPGRDKQAY